MAQKLHPDKNKEGGEHAHRQMQDVNLAYFCLSDPDRRIGHDKKLAEGRARQKAAAAEAEAMARAATVEQARTGGQARARRAQAPDQAAAQRFTHNEVHTSKNRQHAEPQPPRGAGNTGGWTMLGIAIAIIYIWSGSLNRAPHKEVAPVQAAAPTYQPPPTSRTDVLTSSPAETSRTRQNQNVTAKTSRGDPLAGCKYETVMSDADYRACGLRPPTGGTLSPTEHIDPFTRSPDEGPAVPDEALMKR